MPGRAVRCPWQSIFIGFVKTADAVPERQRWYSGSRHHPFPRAGMPTVGLVESSIPQTSHRKDTLHIPDHNIVLGETSEVDTLSMGELEK